MRIRRTERIPIYDIGYLLEAAPAYHDEWQALRFEESVLQNPLTGEPEAGLELLSGRHRAAGAVYRVYDTLHRWRLPADRVAEFDEEEARLRAERATVEEWEDHHKRRGEAGEVVEEPVQFDVELLRDGLGKIAARVGLADDAWTVDVEVRPTAEPQVDVEGKVNLSEMIRRMPDGTKNGCALYFVGGKGKGEATLRTEALGGGGRLLEAKGRANRFRLAVDIDVRPSGDEWEVELDLRIGARGVGRLVPLFFGRKIEEKIDAGLDAAFAGIRREHAEIAETLDAHRRVIEADGGVRPTVHRSLWDPEVSSIPDELADDPAIRRLFDLDDPSDSHDG